MPVLKLPTSRMRASSLTKVQTRDAFTATTAPLNNVQVTTVEGLSFLTQDIDFGAIGVEEVLQNVKYIILTTIYSVPLDREFGIDASFVDKPIPIAQLIIGQEIALKINLYEPRAKFRDIKFAGDGLAGLLQPTIIIDIDLSQPSSSTVPSVLSTTANPTPSSPTLIYQQGTDGTLLPWIRGPQGSAGPPGLAGINAYTETSYSDFVVPPIGQTVSVVMVDASWMVVGQRLWIENAGGSSTNAGTLQVVSKDLNNVILLNEENSTGIGLLVKVGSLVSPGAKSVSALWYTGSGSPSPTIGKVGDMYLQDTGDVWQYIGTGWSKTSTNIYGKAATIGVGITNTLTPGTPATVTNSGNQTAAIFNFGIPQGLQGIQGPQGQQGVTGPGGPTAVSTDVGNLAVLGSDSKILVPQLSIWNSRLRNYNAIGNPNFEVDQINCGGTIPGNNYSVDRWITNYSATMGNWSGAQTSEKILVPNTNFCISQKFLRLVTSGVVSSVPATGYWYHLHQVEGPRLRELINDVHSFQLLVRSSVAGLKFGVALANTAASYCLTKLCTIPTANTWTLIALPNIPIFPAAGSFTLDAGTNGYSLYITLAAGSTYTSTVNDVWQSVGANSVFGALGQDNFLGKLSGSTFDIAFVQHEPGAQCSTLIDLSFNQNYDDCQRYWSKTYPYGSKAGVVMFNGANGSFWGASAGTAANGFGAFKKVMAKAPAVTIYNPNTGAANTAYSLSTGASLAATAVYIGDSGFLQFSGSALTNLPFAIHYTASTGW